MLETAVAFIFGHVVADFLLQSDAMALGKRQPRLLAQHGAIVTLTAWAALGFTLLPWAVLLVAASHIVIDGIKARLAAPGIRAFLADQAAHLATIALAAALFPGAYAGGLWADPPVAAEALAPALERLPQAMALAAGFVAATLAGSHAIRLLMAELPLPEGMPGLPKGGKIIGYLERMVILILVIIEEPGAIGFVIAAKSVLRFSEIKDDQLASEYVIIGTLASFAWALAIAGAMSAALAALGAT
jgi:Protein of unknown function (DUF3307)